MSGSQLVKRTKTSRRRRLRLHKDPAGTWSEFREKKSATERRVPKQCVSLGRIIIFFPKNGMKKKNNNNDEQLELEKRKRRRSINEGGMEGQLKIRV